MQLRTERQLVSWGVVREARWRGRPLHFSGHNPAAGGAREARWCDDLYTVLAARRQPALAGCGGLARGKLASAADNLTEWDPGQKRNHDTYDEIAPDQPLRRGD